MQSTATNRLSIKFLAAAATLAKQIEKLRAPRQDNTPKRAMQAHSARIDADHLQRVKEALEKLAEAREVGTLPDSLQAIKSKAELLTMLKTRIDHSGGYYSLRDTGEYHDQTETAVALRQFLAETTAPVDPTAAKQRAAEELERNIRFTNIPGFFPTPAGVIERMMDKANPRPGMLALEPSAGKGDIADALRAAGVSVICVEIHSSLHEILGHKDVTAVQADFLTLEPERYGPFDLVCQNPPFEDGQDMKHIQHAFKFLKPGGRLVSVMSPGPFFRQDKKAQEFREWFEEVGGVCEALPEDAFKNAFRSTGVRTNLVTIDKEQQ